MPSERNKLTRESLGKKTAAQGGAVPSEKEVEGRFAF